MEVTNKEDLGVFNSISLPQSVLSDEDTNKKVVTEKPLKTSRQTWIEAVKTGSCTLDEVIPLLRTNYPEKAWYRYFGLDEDEQCRNICEALFKYWLPYSKPDSLHRHLIGRTGEDLGKDRLLTRYLDTLCLPKELDKKVKFKIKSDALQIAKTEWLPKAADQAFKEIRFTKGGLALNTFRPVELKPQRKAKYDIEPFRQLLGHLCNYDTKLITHVLNTMARKVREPEKKLIHALVIGGGKGLGKSLFAQKYQKILGEWNTASPNLDQVTGNKGNFLENKLLLVIEEAEGMTKTQENTLKQLITEETICIDRKYGAMSSNVDSYAEFIFLTNEDSAIWMPEGYDRRYCLVWCEQKPKPEGFYEDFAKWRDDQGGLAELLGYLLFEHELGDFNHQTHAPETKHIERFKKASMSDAEMFLEEAIGEELAVTSENIKGHWEHDFPTEAKSSKKVNAAARRLGFTEKLSSNTVRDTEGTPRKTKVIYYKNSEEARKEALELRNRQEEMIKHPDF